MSLFFLVLEQDRFCQQIRPALSASWRQRSFGPCRDLCEHLLAAAGSFAERFSADAPPLFTKVATGLPFQRTLWQHLVGEVLWYSAALIPEIPTMEEALMRLLAPECETASSLDRSSWAPIQQIHHGSRDLILGGGFYRPECAGWNDADDIHRLAEYLKAVQPERWQADDLAGLPQVPEDEYEEELAYVLDWFPALRELYQQAEQDRRILICEQVE
jgi:hypothetical protein